MREAIKLKIKNQKLVKREVFIDKKYN